MAGDLVRDMMVPLEEYPSVLEGATLAEAVVALRKAQNTLGSDRFRHRAVLVTDSENRVVGKLAQVDVLRALDHKLRSAGGLGTLTKLGFGADYLESRSEDFGLLSGPLAGICRRAADIKVKDVMTTPGSGEYVADDANLDEAIHQLVRGSHQSLLVTQQDDVVGMLRLTDVFSAVASIIGDCHG